MGKSKVPPRTQITKSDLTKMRVGRKHNGHVISRCPKCGRNGVRFATDWAGRARYHHKSRTALRPGSFAAEGVTEDECVFLPEDFPEES